jgi:hypothetical protein
MAEDHLSVLGLDAERLEQCRCGVPQIVQPDRPQTVGLADAGERPVDVPRLDPAKCQTSAPARFREKTAPRTATGNR